MAMRDFWDHIHQWGKVCLHCSYPKAAASLYCAYCELTLWSRHTKNSQFQVMDLHCETVFSWFPDQDRQLSRLVSTLKGGRQRKAFDFYAQRFLARQTGIGGRCGDWVLVPCPSRTGRADHAMAFAQSLSKYTGIPVQNLLGMPANTQSQKSKSKEERLQRSLEVRGKLMTKNVIFIDDVVTTGATASSAQRALNVTGSFHVWALAWRRDLAGFDPR